MYTLRLTVVEYLSCTGITWHLTEEEDDGSIRRVAGEGERMHDLDDQGRLAASAINETVARAMFIASNGFSQNAAVPVVSVKDSTVGGGAPRNPIQRDRMGAPQNVASNDDL